MHIFNARRRAPRGAKNLVASMLRVSHACRKHSRKPEDALATATALTAESIAASYEQFVRRTMKGTPVDYIVSGGGAHNATLMRMLRRGSNRWDASQHERRIRPACRSQGGRRVCAAGVDDVASAARECSGGDRREDAGDSRADHVCFVAEERSVWEARPAAFLLLALVLLARLPLVTTRPAYRCLLD